MAETLRYVIVYNPISNEGHLDSWHVLFIKSLRQSGQAVIALSSDPEGLLEKLRAHGFDRSAALVVIPTTVSPAAPLSSMRALWLRWQVLYDQALYQRRWYSPAVKGLGALLKRAHSLYGSVRRRRAHSINQDLQRTTTLDPNQFCEQVNGVLRQYPGQITAILNMYMDAYPVAKQDWENFTFDTDIPWRGLCITPNSLFDEGYYGVNSYVGTYFLDEKVCEAYQTQMPERNFEYLPDIADTSLPSQPSVLAKKIAQKAAGRKVVFMGGSIGKQKNLARWLELIKLANPKEWFFVQIGRLNHNNLLPEDRQALAALVKKPNDNLWLHPEYVPDERTFNEIISISSVIFAVYRDFARSSNMLSKAAYFEKPLLVAKGQLMAMRVETYKIGVAVDQDSAVSMHQGLLMLDSILNIKDNFLNYRLKCNEAVLQEKLHALVNG